MVEAVALQKSSAWSRCCVFQLCEWTRGKSFWPELGVVFVVWGLPYWDTISWVVETKLFFLTVLEARRSTTGTARSASAEPSSQPVDGHPSPCPHVAGRERARARTHKWVMLIDWPIEHPLFVRLQSYWLRAPPLCPYLPLIASQGPSLQMQSDWGLVLQHMNLGEHNSVHRRGYCPYIPGDLTEFSEIYTLMFLRFY